MTLQIIKMLQSSLGEQATAEEIDGWWTLVLTIDSSIERDSRASGHEKALVRRLRDGVSQIYLARNEGRRPDFSPAVMTLSALQRSIESRTIGEDGFPLR